MWAVSTVVEMVVLLESLTVARWGGLTAVPKAKNLDGHWDSQMAGSSDGYSVAKKAAGSVERLATTSAEQRADSTVGPLVVYWAVEMAL